MDSTRDNTTSFKVHSKKHDRYIGYLTKKGLDMSYPKALEGNPKVIFFTDFDGTITLNDSGRSPILVQGPANDLLQLPIIW